MDKFKQYLNTHQDELGNDEPGERVWQNLQQDLPKVRRMSFQSSFFKYAAAACFFILGAFSLWFFRLDTKPVAAPAVISKTNTPNVTGVSSSPFNQASSQNKIATIKSADSYKIVKRKQKHSLTGGVLSKQQSEFRAIETSFTSVINLERHKINHTPLLAEGQSYFAYFKNELKQTDDDESLLKKDIAQNGLSNDALLQLINIYQQKLNILKALHTEMNKTNTLSGEDEQPAEHKKAAFINI